MRIAWMGPSPGEYGGAQYVGTQLLRELTQLGVEIDCFVAAPEEHIPRSLLDTPGLRFFCEASGWEWERWYSRGPLRSFFSGNLTRAATQFRLANRIARLHRERPYDVVYQFSQSEILPLRHRRRELPPIVVHPSTHAAGELKWHQREASLSRQCEPTGKRLVVRAMLHGRAQVQRRDLAVADRVLAVSRRFAEHLARDYRIPSDRLGVVRNPIDLSRFPIANGERPESGPVRLLFVSRMSARKGVNMVVELSHRLGDLAGTVEIVAVGGATTWSDYTPLLAELNPRIARFAGGLSPAQLSQLYRSADAVIQPSLYEPFALTVAEGLASGLSVVASDEVGAVDGVDPAVCSVFPAGDPEAFERSVRDLVDRMGEGGRGTLGPLARSEAERLFAPHRIAADLVNELELAIYRDAPEGQMGSLNGSRGVLHSAESETHNLAMAPRRQPGGASS